MMNVNKMGSLAKRLIADYKKEMEQPPPMPARRTITKPQSSVAERARKYIAHIHSIAGQGGHDSAFTAACTCAIGFNLDLETTRGLMQEWNASNASPPWSTKELEHKINEAYKTKGNTPGDVGRLLRCSSSGSAPDTLHIDNGIPNRERNNSTSGSAPVSSSIFTVDSILNNNGDDDNAEWILDGYLARGNITLLAGRPKGGKSTLTFGLMSALTAGQKFLGRKIDQCNTIYMTEESLNTIKEKLNMFSFKHDNSNLFVLQTMETSDMNKALPMVEARLKENNIGLVVVDTLSAWAGLNGSNENDASTVQRFFNPLRLFARTNNVAVLVIHHTRKPNPNATSQARAQDCIRGSGAISAAVDNILSLMDDESGSTRRKLLCESRSVNNPGDITLDLDHENGKYVVVGSHDLNRIKYKRILDAMRSGGSMTSSEILRMVPALSAPDLDKALIELQHSHIVTLDIDKLEWRIT